MCVQHSVAIRSDRLRILWSLWTLGAAVLFRVMLFVALTGAGAYALIGTAALLLGFDMLPWFYATALIWAPLAVGFALGDVMRRRKALWSREGRPSDLELVAGWGVGGLAMSDRPTWINTGAALIVTGGILSADLAPVAAAIELFEWEMSGDWPGIAVADGLSLPYDICLFVAGLLLCVEGLNLGDRSFRGNARYFSIR
jgi:hypothetical protein